ncbi:D-glycero-beta-D-manno-heptose 1-phosphate adenylyltransferase [bacterium]|nr:D-glycero-beta-D-manno-heptose 1-phosphate adenylyltransferase [bacterium]
MDREKDAAGSVRAADKVMSLPALLENLACRRASGQRVVFTNGCFDIMHPGHIGYLEDARACGDCLVVGLNSDASVRRLKGEERPINPQTDRALMLAGLASVDCVTFFEDDTPIELIRAVRPEVLVKGGDWSVDKIVGSDFVFSCGGQVLSLPFRPGYSTTNIIEKIKALRDSRP